MCEMEKRTRQRVQIVGASLTVSKASVANAKACQGDLLGTVPVARRLLQANGRSQLTQFNTFRNTLIPAGLPSGVYGSSP